MMMVVYSCASSSCRNFLFKLYFSLVAVVVGGWLVVVAADKKKKKNLKFFGWQIRKKDMPFD